MYIEEGKHWLPLRKNQNCMYYSSTRMAPTYCIMCFEEQIMEQCMHIFLIYFLFIYYQFLPVNVPTGWSADNVCQLIIKGAVHRYCLHSEAI